MIAGMISQTTASYLLEARTGAGAGCAGAARRLNVNRVPTEEESALADSFGGAGGDPASPA